MMSEYTEGCSVHWGMFSTPGDTMSTLEVYHDECGDIISTVGVFSTLGVIMSTLGNTKMHVGVIMSTLGDVQYTGGIHEYNGGCSVHWRDTMSTPEDFGTTEKKLLHISRIFVFTSFVTMHVYMLAFETSDSLLRFLYQVARAQTLTHFLFHL